MVPAMLGPGTTRAGRMACATLPKPCARVRTRPHSYSPGWEYTVPTSILKDPTRVPLRSRFLEWITFRAEPPAPVRLGRAEASRGRGGAGRYWLYFSLSGDPNFLAKWEGIWRGGGQLAGAQHRPLLPWPDFAGCQVRVRRLYTIQRHSAKEERRAQMKPVPLPAHASGCGTAFFWLVHREREPFSSLHKGAV